MRVGIDYRMLGMGALTVNRGMGRYTQQQLREVLRFDQDNEYLLLCREHSDTTAILDEILEAPNVKISFMPSLASFDDRDPNGPEIAFRLAAEYQEWLEDQQLDLYHATTPFLLGDLVLPFLDVCPLVATHYDLIPFIYQNQYFGTDSASVSRLAYMRALRFLAGADQIIAISNHVRQEAMTYLAVPEDRITVAYPVADPVFRRLRDGQRKTAIADLRKRLNLNGDYFLTVSHYHHSKNLKTLFAAYGGLPQALRRRIPLVLTCSLLPVEQDQVRQWAGKAGIEEDLVISGLVTDDELVGLYNSSLAYIHPSRYEGFGLPVLEAMRCGAPVITTTAASLPEVAGDAATLVDPDDAEGLTAAMEEIAGSAELREKIRVEGLDHAKHFSPRQLGKATLESYRKAVSTPRRRANRRPRIAMWTPVPPQHTGIADYSAELLKPLSRNADVEVFVDDGVMPDLDLLDLCLVHHHSAFERRHRWKPFDVVIHQMGASLFHLYIEKGLKKYGGVAVLHDLTWGFVRNAVAWNRGDVASLEREIRELEGSQALSDYSRIKTMPQPELTRALREFFNHHFMLGPIVDSTTAQIVHMPEAARDLNSRYPEARPVTIPMGVEDPRESLSHSGWNGARARLGLEHGDFMVGAFGIVDPVKRIDKLIEAIAWLHDHDSDCGVKLVVVGSPATEEYFRELKEITRKFGVTEHVLFLGRVSRRDMDQLLLASDVIASLRFPFPRQMSATLMRGVAAGKPVIITDVEHWRFLPKEFVVHIPAGENEVEELTCALGRLADDPELCHRMGRAARQYYEREGTPELMADRYLDVVRTVTGKRPQPHESQPSRHQDMVDEPLPLCKLWEFEDSMAPEFSIATEVLWPDDHTSDSRNGRLDSDSWATAMALITLKRYGALTGNTSAIHIGAGSSPLTFFLCGKCAEVFAVDCYGSESLQNAPVQMLFDPSEVAQQPFPAERLVVEGMDMRNLRFPDGRFDAAVIARDLAEVRDLQGLANVSHEVGRVLRPGGIATMSLRYRLAGPPGESGTTDWVSVSDEEIERYVLSAGGLELVEDLQLSVSKATWESERVFPSTSDRVQPPTFFEIDGGYCIATLHLAMRKESGARPADWAKPKQHSFSPRLQQPSAATSFSVSKNEMQSSAVTAVTYSDDQPNGAPPLLPPEEEGQIWRRTDLPSFLDRWDQVRAQSSVDDPSETPRLGRAYGFLGRSLRRIRNLGIAWDLLRDLLQALVDWQVSVVIHLKKTITAVFSHLEHFGTQTYDLRQEVDSLTTRVDFLKRDLRESRRPDADLERFEELLVWAQETLGKPDDANAREMQSNVVRSAAFAKECEEFQRSHPAITTENLGLLNELVFRLSNPVSVEEVIPKSPQSTAPLFSLSREQSLSLFAQLDEMDSTISDAQAVEVSIQDLMAEDVLFAAVKHFGDRMSCLDPEYYRAPNDLWINIDFTDRCWDRQNIWENARSRLQKPDGRLVLVTQVDRAVPEDAGLELIDDAFLELNSETVRVFVFGFRDLSPRRN